jgi:hypothetical protein
MTNILTPGECVLITEGSSTRTSVFSFNHDFSINPINGEAKFILHERIDLHAKNLHAEIYYEKILYNPDILNHIKTSDCSKFYWSILSTGGMRKLKDSHGEELELSFYSEIAELHKNKESICENEICKEIDLVKAKTLPGSEEGHFAWKTLQHINNHDDDNCHVVFDLGGETGQITREESVYTSYLGKERNRDEMKDNIETCFNNLDSYNGITCRSNIEEHINIKFLDLPNLGESNCKLYGVSNFYNFLNDICNIYKPYMEEVSVISDDIKETCKNIGTNNLMLTIGQYHNIVDEACHHWSPEWSGKTAEIAKNACFSGNYIYQLLKAIGLPDTAEIHPDDSDWALGAAMLGNHSFAESVSDL